MLRELFRAGEQDSPGRERVDSETISDPKAGSLERTAWNRDLMIGRHACACRIPGRLRSNRGVGRGGKWGGWDSNPLRLSHRIYSPARLSNSGAPPPVRIDCRRGFPSSILAHFELHVLQAPDNDRSPRRNLTGADEPASAIGDEDEQKVTSRLVESLDDAIPALVTTRCAQRDDEPLSGLEARRLDLDPEPGDRSALRPSRSPDCGRAERKRRRRSRSASGSLQPRPGLLAFLGGTPWSCRDRDFFPWSCRDRDFLLVSRGAMGVANVSRRGAESSVAAPTLREVSPPGIRARRDIRPPGGRYSDRPRPDSSVGRALPW